MNSFECYQYYLALKLHFSDLNYDCFKYNFKVKADINSFNSRRDKFFFEKLAKHQNPKDFLLANFVLVSKAYIRDLVYGEEAKTTYKQWLSTKESLSYRFNEELSGLKENFNDNFICHNNSHPHLLKLYLGEKISLETLCILCDITGCLKHWDKKLVDDIVYKDIGMLIKKYTPFIVFDRENIKTIVRNKLKGGS